MFKRIFVIFISLIAIKDVSLFSFVAAEEIKVDLDAPTDLYNELLQKVNKYPTFTNYHEKELNKINFYK